MAVTAPQRLFAVQLPQLLATRASSVALACALSNCDACSPNRTTRAGAALGPDASTLSILAAQSPLCSRCAASHGCLDPALQGGVCELTEGRVPIAFGGILDGSAPTLDPPAPNAGYKANCLQTLQDTFASHCADSLSLTPCLCGNDPAAASPCIEGLAPPAGPLVPDYVNSFHSNSGKAIQDRFIVQTFGAGQANSIIQCVAAFDCRCCFGLDGGAC